MRGTVTGRTLSVMRTSRSSLLIVPLLAATACASSGAADTLGARGDVAPTQPRATATTPPSWTGYHGGGAHLGYSSTTPAVTTLRRPWTRPLDGKVYGSPLVIGNRVIAATENNTVYALDRSTGRVLWSRHLATPARLSHLPCGNIDPLGITGTPVFDPATQRIFAVTTAASGSSLAHLLWGLDVSTGRTGVRVSADVPGQNALVENQRGALALSRGRVLIPYGGHAGDCGNYHGYLVSTTTAGTDKRIFRTGTQREAGMWQAAGAAVNPTTGTAYVVSGNGSATSGAWDGSDSVNAVDPVRATRLSYFAPRGWAQENAVDADLGSSGVALLSNGNLWIQGKTSTGYVLSQTALGGIGGQRRTITGACAKQFGGPAVHGTVVYAPCTDGVRRINTTATQPLGWKAPSNLTGSPVVGGGAVFVLDPSGGTLSALSESTGRLISRVPVGVTTRFATPALSGSMLFVPTLTGISAVSGA